MNEVCNESAIDGYTRLRADRDAWAMVGMDVVRALLRPGDWNRDSLVLRRLAHAVRQYDHASTEMGGRHE